MAEHFSFKWISETYGIPLSSMYLYKREGRGPETVRIGRHYRVSGEALKEWLSENQALNSERPRRQPEPFDIIPINRKEESSDMNTLNQLQASCDISIPESSSKQELSSMGPQSGADTDA